MHWVISVGLLLWCLACLKFVVYPTWGWTPAAQTWQTLAGLLGCASGSIFLLAACINIKETPRYQLEGTEAVVVTDSPRFSHR